MASPSPSRESRTSGHRISEEATLRESTERIRISAAAHKTRGHAPPPLFLNPTAASLANQWYLLERKQTMLSILSQFADQHRTHEEEMVARGRSAGGKKGKSRRVIQEEDPIIQDVSPGSKGATWTEENRTRAEEEADHGHSSVSSNSKAVTANQAQVVVQGENNRIATLDLKGDGEVRLSFSIPTSVLGHGAVLSQQLGITTRSLRPDKIILNFNAASAECQNCDRSLRDTRTIVSASFAQRCFSIWILKWNILFPVCVPCSHVSLCFMCAISALGKNATCPACNGAIREVFKVTPL